MSVAIKLENISKQYRLGQVGTGTISHDLNRWWHRVRGKEDPYSQVGQENRRDQAAESEYVWALKDINLEVEQGEVLGIIGANGAGKSTLLKLISRITSPTTGAIKAKGRIASLLEVGTGMHPEMTARENIYLNGSILGMRRHEITKKFDDIVDFAGCRMYVDTPVKRYSSGMRVRLGFAVAAFLDPEILIVDEVLAVGDAEFQKRAIGKMQEVSRGGGRTVLFVSHNMASVSSLCTTACLLDTGLATCIGPTETVLTNYLAKRRIAETTDFRNQPRKAITHGSHITLLSCKIGQCSHNKVPITLDIQNHRSSRESVTVSLTLFDQLDHPVCTGTSNRIDIPAEAFTTLAINVPTDSLPAGTYSFNMSISDQKYTGANDDFDVVQRVGPLTVQYCPESDPLLAHWKPYYGGTLLKPITTRISHFRHTADDHHHSIP